MASYTLNAVGARSAKKSSNDLSFVISDKSICFVFSTPLPLKFSQLVPPSRSATLVSSKSRLSMGPNVARIKRNASS